MPYLTKSRFKQALECPDKLRFAGKKDEYADNRDQNEFLRELAKGGMQIGELAKCYFPAGIEVETLDNEKALEITAELMLRENVIIFEAAISYENMLVRVDVLEKKGSLLNLYEAKSKSYTSVDEIFYKHGKAIRANWRKYVYDIAFQVFVARKAFPNHQVYGSLFLVNKNLTCSVDGLNQKFLVRKVNNRYKVYNNPALDTGHPILDKVDIGDSIDDILLGTEELAGLSLTFENYVFALARAYTERAGLNIPVSKQCKTCEYTTSSEDRKKGLKSGFEECWIAKTKLKKSDLINPLMFNIWNFRKSDELFDQRKYFIKDLTQLDFPIEKKSGNRLLSIPERQWLQVERVLMPELGPYVDKVGIAAEVAKLRYPLHFIDFEATRNAIPYLKGFRPYAQFAFQFSHHCIDKRGNVTHSGEWISTQPGTYPSFDFIRELKKQLNQDEGSIFIYSPFENSVLCDILTHLNASDESDKGELIDFIKTITWSSGKAENWSGPRRMIDLKDWIMDFYLSPVMKGSNSIKAVLPAIITDSAFVRSKYPEWIKPDGAGGFRNPYELLPPVFDNVDNFTFERLLEDEDIADGGAAMCAFNLMQFSEMSDAERSSIVKALLAYCKLDTLAMVMLFEGLTHF